MQLVRLLRGLVADLFARLWRWYVERLVCLHFCTFKEAGSDLTYVHVHVLGPNPGKKTGLGHDDETNVDDPGHVTVSDADGTTTVSAETAATTGLRQGYLGTAYFIEGSAGGPCPPGFRRIRCRCSTAEGPQDVWVCYTMEHQGWEGWHQGQKYPDRTGNFVEPSIHEQLVGDRTPGTVACGASVVLLAYDFERVPDCSNHTGPNAGENPLVQEARRKLQAAVDKIQCEAGCRVSHTETFKGWKCERISGPSGLLEASAAVQWTVRCSR